MKRFGCLVAVLLGLGLAPLSAQEPQPARPADPNQPLPALPVEPNSLEPVPPGSAPEKPASNAPAPAPAATNGAFLSVIADVSLKAVIQELAQSWADSQENSPQVPLTLTNAKTLRTKVEGGGNWDVVIGADVQDMKDLTTKGALLADDQRSLARNTLVIYARSALIKDDDLEWFELVGSEWKKMALGDPDMVASGRVARRALQKHDLFDDDHKRLYVLTGTEALALGSAQKEQADAVFLYRTDLAGVKLPGFEIFPIKTEDAPPVFYTAAIARQSKNVALARAFLDYCTSDPAKEIWKKYGFETN